MTEASQEHSETQAARITRICGVERLAKWTGRTPTQVYRWAYPREKGGAGGTIPAVHHQSILNGAQAENIPLAHSDFFTQPQSDSSDSQQTTQ